MDGLIAGQVIDDAGRAVDGASVAIGSGPGPHSDLAALTNEEGRFRLPRLIPGDYVITTFAPGFPAQDTHVTVHDGQAQEIIIAVGGVSRPLSDANAPPTDLGARPPTDGRNELVVTIDPVGIDWDQVRLIRVSLFDDPPAGNQPSRKELLFSPTRTEPVDRTVTGHRAEQGRYTVAIVFYLVGGLVQEVGPKESSDLHLSLEQAKRHG